MDMLESFWSDSRYAARSLSRSPGFTAAAIMTIALGIGLNTGVFTILNGVLFRDLPAPDAHQLVSIQQTVEGEISGSSEISGRTPGAFSALEYHTYRDRVQTLSGVLAHGQPRQTALGGEAPQAILGMDVSCNYFTVLQQPPALGRALTAPDCEPGADPVVVLGHELWTTTFAADAGILGRSIELNRQLFTVVGVAAEGTYGGSTWSPGYFAPISAEPLLRPNESRYENDRFLWLYLTGRLGDGVRVEQARAELGVIAAQIDQQQPGRLTSLSIERAVPMTVPFGFRGAALGTAAVLMAAFGLILLIACANVANLLLARGTARSHEIGIRLSLGASRARVMRQVLTESMLISVAGGIAGAMLAVWSFQALVALALPALLPAGAPPVDFDLSPDLRVAWFAVAVTIGTSLLFGAAPALHVSKQDLHAVAKQGTAGAGGSSRGGRLRGTLIGVQVALCMTLMIAAGLLLRGLLVTHTIDLGFAYRDVITVSLALPSSGYAPEELASVQQRLMHEVEALPGVDAVAYARLAPLSNDGFSTVRIRLPDRNQEDHVPARLNGVTPAYFSLLGIPMVRGRSFTEAEVSNAALAAGEALPVIVSETTARNLWPEADPLDQTLMWGSRRLRVIGVAADAQVTVIGQIDPYYIYVPTSVGQVLLVKSRIDFGAQVSAIRAVAGTLEPAVAVRVLPLEANLAWWRAVSTTVAAVGAGLGALALLLASVGIYGVVSYSVTRRYREIGVRMALGAEARDVLSTILRRTMRPVVIGGLIGMAIAITLSGILSSVLFGISPSDPVALGGGALFVLAVAFAAAIMAAQPATRADPAAALHRE